MPFGTPGGDVQTQAMLQVFMNIHVFGMEPQEAVEAPRCASYSYPRSFEPHSYHPGLVYLEKRIDGATGDALGRMGHKVDWWPEWTWLRRAGWRRPPPSAGRRGKGRAGGRDGTEARRPRGRVHRGRDPAGRRRGDRADGRRTVRAGRL